MAKTPEGTEASGKFISNKHNPNNVMEYARTFFQKAKGLMFRKEPPEGGMLFVFKNDGMHSIWMPFMRFPIKIIFYDSKGKIINAVENAKPISFDPKTWKIYRPEGPCKYILEIRCNGKYKKKLDIKS